VSFTVGVGVGGGGGGGGGGAAGQGAASAAGPPAAREGTVVAPMQGLILALHVRPGQAVQVGETVAVLEAMKMQNDITTTRAGTVTEVFVAEGDVVAAKAPIAQVS